MTGVTPSPGKHWYPRAPGIVVVAEHGQLRLSGTFSNTGAGLKSLRTPDVIHSQPQHSVIMPVLDFLDHYYQHLVVKLQLNSEHSRPLNLELY